MHWSRRLLVFFADAFRPPFRSAPWIVLLYIYLSFIDNPTSAFNKWQLPDTDDYLRLIQVSQFFDGQGWYDFTVGRLNPQHPLILHWSRLVDLPLAACLWLFDALNNFFQWHATRAGLQMLTAFVVPGFIMTALLFLLRGMGRPLLGKSHAGLAALLVPLTLLLTFQFSPMRVDHHAYILLSAGVTFYALLRVALERQPLRHAALAGFALAFGSWNGGEILPMIVATGFILTVLMLRPCPVPVPAPVPTTRWALGPVFALSLTATTFVLLFLARAPDVRWTIIYDTFSAFYLVLALFGSAYFLVFGAARFCIRRHPWLLLAFATFTALTALAWFFHFFPDFINGPYARTNPLLKTIFFPNIREAVPFIDSFVALGEGFAAAPQEMAGGMLLSSITRLFVPCVGLLAALTFAWQTRHQRRFVLWAITSFLIAFFLALTFFWEVRLLSYAQLFALAPMAGAIFAALRSLPRHYTGRTLFAWEILLVMAFTLLPVVIIPNVMAQKRFNPDLLFFPGGGGTLPCDSRMNVIAELLNMEDHGEIATILAPLDYTPELMFYTKQKFIAAPYHRNDGGILDMTFFFRSTDDDRAARAIAKRLKLDYVLMCKPGYYQSSLRVMPEARHVTIDADTGNTSMGPSPTQLEHAMLAVRLANDRVPTWLTPVQIPLESEFGFYRVNQNLLDAPSAYAGPIKPKPKTKLNPVTR